MKRLKARRELEQFIKWQKEEWDIEFPQKMIDDTYKLIELLPDNIIQPEFFNKSYSTVPNVINVVLNGKRFNIGYLEMLGGKIYVEKLDEDHYWWPGSGKTFDFTDEIPKEILDFIDKCCMRDEQYSKQVVESIPWKRQSRKEWKAFEKSISHLPPERRLASMLAYPLRKKLDYAGVSRKLIKVEKLEDGSPAVFDKDINFNFNKDGK